mgnify:FL=1
MYANQLEFYKLLSFSFKPLFDHKKSVIKQQKNSRDLMILRVRFVMLVRVEGLEPPRRETPDPKSGASANSAIRAHIFQYKPYFGLCQNQ